MKTYLNLDYYRQFKPELYKLYTRVLRKREAYRSVFDVNNRDTNFVLNDLLKFCKSQNVLHRDKSDKIDEFATAVAIGRREVIDRIFNMIYGDDQRSAEQRVKNLMENSDG